MGPKTIMVLVGSEKKSYTIHQKLLLSVSELCFGNYMYDSGIIELSDIKIEVFEAFLDWLYDSDLQRLRQKAVSISDLIDLYVFAEENYCSRFRDAIMDALQDNLAENDRSLCFKDVEKIFSTTYNFDDIPLREFCAAFSNWKLSVDKDLSSGQLEKCFQIHRFKIEYLDIQAKFSGQNMKDPRIRGTDMFPDCYFHDHWDEEDAGVRCTKSF